MPPPSHHRAPSARTAQPLAPPCTPGRWQHEAKGWNNILAPLLASETTNVTRVSDTVLELGLPQALSYDISAVETISVQVSRPHRPISPPARVPPPRVPPPRPPRAHACCAGAIGGGALSARHRVPAALPHVPRGAARDALASRRAVDGPRRVRAAVVGADHPPGGAKWHHVCPRARRLHRRRRARLRRAPGVDPAGGRLGGGHLGLARHRHAAAGCRRRGGALAHDAEHHRAPGGELPPRGARGASRGSPPAPFRAACPRPRRPSRSPPRTQPCRSHARAPPSHYAPVRSSGSTRSASR